MKTLELNQMENLNGGKWDTSTCLGMAVGAAAIFTFATIATGGAFALLAVGAIGSLNAGALC